MSQRRRDWAFSERDKIVRERESVRALSGQLRGEKDRAVANLAEALRDLDDMMKQRDELVKQLKLAKYVFLALLYCMYKNKFYEFLKYNKFLTIFNLFVSFDV